MTGFDLMIVILNMVGAVAAFVCNVWAAVHGTVRLRPLRVGIAVLAAIYVAAYGWLAVEEEVVGWSRVMRGVALVAWLMVWCGPAVMGVRTVRQVVTEIEQLGERSGES